MLEDSGKLLVRAPRQASQQASLQARGFLDGYAVEPLFSALEASLSIGPEQPRPKDFWILAKPISRVYTTHPWDQAHEIAKRSDYALYAEPDLLQDFSPPYPNPPAPPPPLPLGLSFPVAPTHGMNRNWPPKDPVSPAWHLEARFTGFATIRDKALGDGIRIAHLDTGYAPRHESTPERVAFERNFYEDNEDAIDPGMTGFLLMPGHGTATMALLAAPRLDLIFGGEAVSGYFGGAPKAEIVPVRISPTVIHLWTRAMARGIDYALAPRNDPTKRCDVITISMGGFPAASWAAAVNNAYDAGIVIVAAAGNNFNAGIIDFPRTETVWPSYYERVITAVGATYDKAFYRTNVFGEMQGNYGPPSIMHKAIAAFTPNIAWMNFKTREEYDMNGAGTSSATPQVAAACALWLELYGKGRPKDWRRVEACRRALFRSAEQAPPEYRKYLGRGYLNVPKLLASALTTADEESLTRSPNDGTEYKPWRAVAGAPKDFRDEMLETEATQIIFRSRNAQLARLIYELQHKVEVQVTSRTRSAVLNILREEPDISLALSARIEELAK